MRWTAEFIVGLFVLIALALFAYFTISIGRFTFRPPEIWTVRFDDVSGLKDGDPVLALGARVGRVSHFEFQTDHVDVTLELTDHVDLFEDYDISVRAPSVLANFHVYIKPGTAAKPKVTDLAHLRGQSPIGLFGDVKRAIDDLTREEGGLGRLLLGAKGYERLTSIIERADKIAAEFQKGDGHLGDLLLGKQAHADLTKTLENAKGLSADLSGKTGALGRLLLSDAARADIDKILANAQSVTQRAQEDGGLGHLILGKDPFERLNAALDNAKSLSAKLDRNDGHLGRMLLGEKPHGDLAATLDNAKNVAADLKANDGALGRLLVGRESYDRVAGTLKDAREVVQKVNQGDGTIARLINDAAMYNDLKKTMDTFAKVAADISEGKGTIGKLVADSGLHDTAMKVLKQISSAIEDAREQAPISAFSGALLGGFR